MNYINAFLVEALILGIPWTVGMITILYGVYKLIVWGFGL